mmetsp:Transcript_12220/g.22164  ORF Transcript_12220/g.22164 Transcript_12220/m.22164 type:complete len:82 (+) Transcript_12220:1364-1609(+)
MGCFDKFSGCSPQNLRVHIIEMAQNVYTPLDSRSRSGQGPRPSVSDTSRKPIDWPHPKVPSAVLGWFSPKLRVLSGLKVNT